MASASLELQAAVYASLIADAALSALLGGARVYDDVPRGAQYPYVSFGPSTARDWSTGTEAGDEHTLILHVWTRSAGHRDAHRIMTALRDRLHGANLALPSHTLVNLRHETSEARRERGGEAYRGVVRFRAVTEPN